MLNNTTKGIILVLADLTLIHSIRLRGKAIATHLQCIISKQCKIFNLFPGKREFDK